MELSSNAATTYRTRFLGFTLMVLNYYLFLGYWVCFYFLSYNLVIFTLSIYWIICSSIIIIHILRNKHHYFITDLRPYSFDCLDEIPSFVFRNQFYRLGFDYLSGICICGSEILIQPNIKNIIIRMKFLVINLIAFSASCRNYSEGESEDSSSVFGPMFAFILGFALIISAFPCLWFNERR